MALLSEGLGSLHPSFSPDRIAGAQQLLNAQSAAQRARKGVWKDYDAAAAAEDAAAAAAEAAPADPGAPRAVAVTHVDSAARFYLQAAEGEVRFAATLMLCKVMVMMCLEASGV